MTDWLSKFGELSLLSFFKYDILHFDMSDYSLYNLPCPW
ncbi:hypothetical protein BSSX_0927 [Bacillus subtilis]|nr:hypothetical protein BSSX_0927 [Bacillus subtilis]